MGAGRSVVIGSGSDLLRSAGVQGSAGHAGLRSRPWLSSRACLGQRRLRSTWSWRQTASLMRRFRARARPTVERSVASREIDPSRSAAIATRRPTAASGLPVADTVNRVMSRHPCQRPPLAGRPRGRVVVGSWPGGWAQSGHNWAQSQGYAPSSAGRRGRSQTPPDDHPRRETPGQRHKRAATGA